MFKCHCCSGECKKSGHYRNRNRVVQRFLCVRCGRSFSESQPLDGLRLDHSKVVQVVRCLTEGVGIRATARLVDCDPHTVLDVLGTVGEKCGRLHDKWVRDIKTGSLQIDELWARVGVRESRRPHGDDEQGDFYTFLALATREKLIVSQYTGKRNAISTDFFVADVAKRVSGQIQVTTDAWHAYPDTIRRYLLERLDYAVMQKKYATTPGVVQAARRYSPAPYVGVTIETIAGAPRADRVCTSHVERCNLTVRHFNKRFVRLGLGWSRKLENHRASVALFVAAYNFCKVHTTMGCTPAVALKLTDHTWKVEELIEEAAKLS